MTTFFCCQCSPVHTDSYNSFIYALFTSLLAFSIALFLQWRDRRIINKNNLYKEVHKACSGILQRAESYNGHRLTQFYFLKLYEITEDKKEYNLEMTYKNYDYAIEDGHKFFEETAILNASVYAIRKYFRKDVRDFILELLARDNDKLPFKNYKLFFQDCKTLEEVESKYNEEHPKIFIWVFEESDGNRFQAIRKKISDLKEFTI